jgi:hypothetical protein
MKNPVLKSILLSGILMVATTAGFAQYKEYKLNAKGDTINAVSQKGLKVGKWVMHHDELRGEPGYEEEGVFKNGEKDGYWRKYTLDGDLLAVENYKMGGKDGLQQYYSFVGELVREESWRGFNPDAPYDTIPIYGTGSNEILEYKIVKAIPYAVKHGQWRYYEDGMVVRTEEYDRNNLVAPKAATIAAVEREKPKKVEKTAEMVEWERKNKGKKNAIRDGATGL